MPLPERIRSPHENNESQIATQDAEMDSRRHVDGNGRSLRCESPCPAVAGASRAYDDLREGCPVHG